MGLSCLFHIFFWSVFHHGTKLVSPPGVLATALKRKIQNNMFQKPAHLSYEEAAMLEPLSCVVYGMDQVEVKPDDTILIIGAGAIGLLHVMVSRALGAERVIVAGRRENRLKLAWALGADAVIDVEKENTFNKVKELIKMIMTHSNGSLFQQNKVLQMHKTQ